MAMLVRKAEETPLSPSFKKKALTGVVSQSNLSKSERRKAEVAAHNAAFDTLRLKAPQVKSNVVPLDSSKGPKAPINQNDDKDRLDAWLASYASFNDGQAPERTAYLVDEYGRRTGKKTKVNRLFETRLEPGDRWGADSRTRSKYIEKDVASHGSRGKPYLRLAHSNESNLLETDAWDASSSTEKKLEGFVNLNRPPSLQDIFVNHYRRLEAGLYTDKPTRLDIQGWGLYHVKDSGQTMNDFYRHLNQFDTEDEKVVLDPPVLTDVVTPSAEESKGLSRDLTVEDSRQIITNRYGHSEEMVPIDYLIKLYKIKQPITLCNDPRYQRWLEFPTYNSVTHVPSDQARLDFYWKCKAIESDDFRYQCWLAEERRSTVSYIRSISVQWDLVHKTRYPAVENLEQMLTSGRLPWRSFERAMDVIYSNSEKLWNDSLIAELERVTTVTEAAYHPLVTLEASNDPIEIVDYKSLINWDKVALTSDRVLMAESIYVNSDGIEPQCGSANDARSSPPPKKSPVGAGMNYSWQERENDFQLHIIDGIQRKERAVNKPEKPGPNDYVLKDPTLGFVKIVGGVMVPDHVEEIQVTHIVPTLDSMFEDMVFDSKRKLWLPVSSMSILDEVKSGLTKMWDDIGS